MTEIWKPASGWPRYSVSNLGRVRRDVGGRGAVAGKILTSHISQKYTNVRLRKGRRGFSVLVHRLVLETFVGPPATGQEARHLDDIKTHNYLSNLAWGSRVENVADRKRNGIHRGFADMTEKEFKISARKAMDTMQREGILWGGRAMTREARKSAARKRLATLKRRGINSRGRKIT